jgi:hypothetical protein
VEVVVEILQIAPRPAILAVLVVVLVEMVERLVLEQSVKEILGELGLATKVAVAAEQLMPELMVPMETLADLVVMEQQMLLLMDQMLFMLEAVVVQLKMELLLILV